MGKVVRIIGLREEQSDLSYWLTRSPEERLAAMETFRQQNFKLINIMKNTYFNKIHLLILLIFFISSCKTSVEPNRATINPNEIPQEVFSKLGETSALFWTMEEKAIGFKNIDKIFPTRTIEAGRSPYPLPKREDPRLLKMQFQFENSTYDIEDFISKKNIFGLLVIKNGDVVLERYANGNTSETKWISFSVAKSVVSMLVGSAVKDGYIPDLDVPVTNYLPILKGSEYEKVTIRQAMQMASGVKWNEDYNDPESDIAKSTKLEGTLGLLNYLKDLPRVAPPGERFNYNTAETQLVGAVLRAAIGNNLSTYLSSKIWKPFGMEADANWVLESQNGVEHGGCCISATLRDYGRIGLFAITEQNNASVAQKVLPDGWMEETTKPSPAADFYGSLWWVDKRPVALSPIDWAGAYEARGVFGQVIWINPDENLVIVTHGAWPEARGNGEDNYFDMVNAFAVAATDLLKN